MGNNYIYLLFTRSNTLMSRAIFLFTNDTYTHVSISTDDTLEEFYSFGRRMPHMMLPAGFTKESVYGGLYSRDGQIPCKLVRIQADKSDINKVESILAFCYEHRFQYKYSIIGTIMCKLGIRYERMQHRFCSQFASELLQECQIMERSRDPSLIRPSQLAEEPYVHTMFEGDMQGLRDWMEQSMDIHPYVIQFEGYHLAHEPDICS